MRRKICILCCVLLFSTCNNLEEINIDPTSVSTIHPQYILPAIQTSAAYNQGTNGPRVAGITMQYFSGGGLCGAADNYMITPVEMNLYWEEMYTGLVAQNNAMIEQATRENTKFYIALAKLYKALAFGELTAYFGDIPVSEAGLGSEFLRPKYDKQIDIYPQIIQLLDEAIDLLSAPDSSYIGGDLVYAGDWNQWTKCAKALKARYLIQQEKIFAGNVNDLYNEVLQLVGESFQSSEEEPLFTFEDNVAASWSLARFGVERPFTLWINSTFSNKIYAQNDPRAPYLMAEDDYEMQYFISDNDDLYWGQFDCSVPLISYCELKFIEAECTHKTGGSADVPLRAAVRANMKTLGVSDGDFNTYAYGRLNTSGLDNDQMLELIFNEAYKCYFGFNFGQTYANYRRTGRPYLTTLPNRENVFNPSGAIPKRYTYPLSEATLNTANLNEAVDRQSGALLDVPIWVFED